MEKLNNNNNKTFKCDAIATKDKQIPSFIYKNISNIILKILLKFSIKLSKEAYENSNNKLYFLFLNIH